MLEVEKKEKANLQAKPIKNKIKRTPGEKTFDIINIVLMCLVGFVTLYPFWYVLIAAMSDPTDVVTGKVLVWFGPAGLNFSAYEKVMGLKEIWISYANTIFYAFVGTTVSMIMTILGAYPLSKARLHGRKLFATIMLITMWFSPGMMPFFINLKNLNLLDNRWTMIFAFALTAFYVILMRTFFESGVPESLEESAKMDGANDWLVLFRIYLPLSVPALMTVGLYYFVGRWNSYFWAMIILRDMNKVPLQVVLKKLIVEATMTSELRPDVDVTTFNEQTLIYATIVIAVVPMLLLYPFIQKFFVKGIMVGAVKG